MAEILGLGATHYPGFWMHDDDMSVILKRTLNGKRLDPALQDTRNWPEAMREEWGDDEGAAAAGRHRARCFRAFDEQRRLLDAFQPDFILMFGDDQYENFTEDVVPPFCVYLADTMASRPYDVPESSPFPGRNQWNEPKAATFRHTGHPQGGRYLLNRLNEAGLALPYAYRLRYDRGLPHAFINTLLYLDAGRRGFPHPVVPFHVNCYGGDLIRMHGGLAPPSEAGAEPDPASPSPRQSFELGRAIARALAASPWRVAIVASSSWSHAFLTPRHGWLYPDHESDRARLDELTRGGFRQWDTLTTASLEAAGQHELLNWIVLAGAMTELGHRPRIIDYIETYVFNANRCFAVFDPA
ncbi:hypothetical protein WKR98_04125 [Pigmentiphaga sp. YJ18]|uniref:DODA-type extradiol aromatic ring-opening family dioxygenase n=1 Tax=Pigmentiphaga sp. YJ18 TaxID=3134907 RepID=UPI00310FD2BF